MTNIHYYWYIAASIFFFNSFTKASKLSDFLGLGDEALSIDDYSNAIQYYEKGISHISPGKSKSDEELVQKISIYTNYGSALSTVSKIREAIDAYQKAISIHDDEITNEASSNEDATMIAAQAAFYLGMTYHDEEKLLLAANAYALANTYDPKHWSSMANMGAVLMEMTPPQIDDSLIAYNRAYNILTSTTEEPTDYPPEPRFILSQLQYRIGMTITHDPTRKCYIMGDEDKNEKSCKELAAHAFSLATEYDDKNEHAKHMLATITADATVKRASNEYVTDLFEQYAKDFEHSLVQELGYTGYERLRLCFDRAFGGKENVPTFKIVVDAGCGTGLVGEQFRNVSDYLLGVDLSESILLEAKKARPNLYDGTRVGDVTQVFRDMKRSENPISLIVAADSYIYFGDLDPLFQSMVDGLDDNGVVAFTLENVGKEDEISLGTSKPNWRWQLTASGRFAHRKEYVEYVSEKYGLHILRYEAMDGFRYERGVPVRGHMFVLKKKSGHSEL